MPHPPSTALMANKTHPGEPVNLLVLFTKHRWAFVDKILGDSKAAAQKGSDGSMVSVFPKAADWSFLPSLGTPALSWELGAAGHQGRRHATGLEEWTDAWVRVQWPSTSHSCIGEANSGQVNLWWPFVSEHRWTHKDGACLAGRMDRGRRMLFFSTQQQKCH